MLKKLKNKALNLNLKKSFVILAIISVIYAIGSGIVMYQNFGGSLSQIADRNQQQREEWLQSFEQYGTEAGEQPQGSEWIWGNRNNYYGNWAHQGKDLTNRNYGYFNNDWEQELDISANDRVLLGVLSGIGMVLGAVYWLLCMAWAYQKADKMGSNKGLWTIAALFFNLWAIIAMYGYSLVKGTCKNCGRLKNKNEKYCSQCGAVHQQECGNCQAPVQNGSKFCPNCGKAINL